MAVAENAEPKNDTSGQNLEAAKLRSDSAAANNDQGPPLQVEEEGRADETLLANGLDSDRKQRRRDGDDDGGHVVEDDGSGDDDRVEVVGGGKVDDDAKSVGDGGGGFGGGARNDNKGYIKSSHHDHINQQMLEMLSKLNPMAEEFVPPSLANGYGYLNNGIAYANNFAVHDNHGNGNGPTNRKKKNNYSQGRRRMTTRTSVAQREEMIRRTVYVSDIDLQVTEEHLAGLFSNCGQVVDCRVCGDPNSVLRFAFIEFTDEESAKAALVLSGTVLGYYPLRVLPSKTAIAPVNPTFLPRSEDEREMCARTIYCTNIDKKVTQADVRLFFESFCGEVHRLRILGDYHHSTRIAFIEFAMAECAIAALNCSGIILGSLPIRVSPSKTPVRPRMPRSQPH